MIKEPKQKEGIFTLLEVVKNVDASRLIIMCIEILKSALRKLWKEISSKVIKRNIQVMYMKAREEKQKKQTNTK